MHSDYINDLDYIADMADQLYEMAKNKECPVLALLLKMAAQEGRTIAKNYHYNEKENEPKAS